MRRLSLVFAGLLFASAAYGQSYPAPIFGVFSRTISAAPTYTFPVGLSTLFTGDMSKAVLPFRTSITGACTLGCPTTGYQWNPATTAILGYGVNTSGHNEGTASNAGRTGAALIETYARHQGQGDYVGWHYFNLLESQRAGATHFLASPAISILAADIGTSVAGGYLQGIGDVNLSDSGHDTAAIGLTFNYDRTVATRAIGQVWLHDRPQSVGAAPIDAFYSPYGKANVGYDATAADFGATKAAMALKADDRIYLNAASNADSSGAKWYANDLRSTYLYYDAANASLNTVVGGNALLQVYNNQIVIAGNTFTTGDISIGAGKAYQVNGVNVIDPSGGHVLAKKTAATLPTCNSDAEGTLYAVTDANSATFNATLAGGGSNHVMAYCNGSNWTVH